jgi:hypothetical protein
MDWREFFSSVIGSVAWPVSAVVIVAVLRGKILEWLKDQGPVKRAKVGTTGFELEFEQKLGELKKKVEDEIPADKVSNSVSPEDRKAGEGFLSEIESLAAVDPRAAVLMSFVRLETTFRECLEDEMAESQSRPVSMLGMRQMIDYAAKGSLVSPNEVRILKDLTLLRNSVVHGHSVPISQQAAQEYADLAYRAAIALRLGLGQTSTEGADPL